MSGEVTGSGSEAKEVTAGKKNYNPSVIMWEKTGLWKRQEHSSRMTKFAWFSWG